MSHCASSNPSVAFFNCSCDAVVTRNYFNLSQYACHSSFFQDTPALPLYMGYVVIIGLGLGFALVCLLITWSDYKYMGTEDTSEHFISAGRSIKLGLTATDIVSKWTWAATLLQSANVAYKYGVSGPFWYAAGASIQVMLFSMLAVQIKRRAPTAHTFLEIVRARWGTAAHIVFMVFGFITNLLVTSMLVLGGSAVVNALTGMNTDLASILIPPGVVVYTLAGGLKATFVASYLHTVIIMVALCIFTFLVYAHPTDMSSSANAAGDMGGGASGGANNSTSGGSSSASLVMFEAMLGSPANVWERLQYVASIEPVPGNRDGSLLTMFSSGGLMFGIINIVGNFGAVFVDQAYWQSAVAATPSASWKGYILGGLCWFSIPFTLATSLGLAANALSLPLSKDEADAGLVPAAAAVYLMGSSGSILILVMLFMAITSSASGEQIAVSSLLAFDVYRTYINPAASGTSIIKVSRWSILIFGLLMGPFAVGLNHIGLGLGWLYLFMGVIIGAAVFPIAFAISWSNCSRVAAITGAVLGSVLGLVSWLIAGYSMGGGVISIATLGTDDVMLVGNLVSLLSSGVICVVLSLIWPDNSRWEDTTLRISLVEEDPHAHNTPEMLAALNAAMRKIVLWGISLSILFILVWPLLTLAAGVFSLPFFTFWVVLSMIWGLVASAVIIFLPLWEYRHDFVHFATLVWRGSKQQPYLVHQKLHEDTSGTDEEGHGRQRLEMGATGSDSRNESRGSVGSSGDGRSSSLSSGVASSIVGPSPSEGDSNNTVTTRLPASTSKVRETSLRTTPRGSKGAMAVTGESGGVATSETEALLEEGEEMGVGATYNTMMVPTAAAGAGAGAGGERMVALVAEDESVI